MQRIPLCIPDNCTPLVTWPVLALGDDSLEESSFGDELNDVTEFSCSSASAGGDFSAPLQVHLEANSHN